MGDGMGISAERVTGRDASWRVNVHGGRAAKIANGGLAALSGLQVSPVQAKSASGSVALWATFDAEPPRVFPEKGQPVNQGQQLGSALRKMVEIRNEIAADCSGSGILTGRALFNGLACAALMIQLCNNLNKTYRLEMACKVIGEISKLFAEAKEIRSAALSTRIMGIVAGSVGLAMGGFSVFSSVRSYGQTAAAARKAGCETVAADLRSANMAAKGKTAENLKAAMKPLTSEQKIKLSEWQSEQKGKLQIPGQPDNQVKNGNDRQQKLPEPLVPTKEELEAAVKDKAKKLDAEFLPKEENAKKSIQEEKAGDLKDGNAIQKEEELQENKDANKEKGPDEIKEKNQDEGSEENNINNINNDKAEKLKRSESKVEQELKLDDSSEVDDSSKSKDLKLKEEEAVEAPDEKGPSEESVIQAREEIREDIKKCFRDFKDEMEKNVADGKISAKDAKAIIGAARAHRDDVLAKVSTKDQLARDLFSAKNEMKSINEQVQSDDCVMRANMIAQVANGIGQAGFPILGMFYSGMGMREVADSVTKGLQAGQRADSFNEKEFDSLLSSAKEMVQKALDMANAIFGDINAVGKDIARNIAG